MRRRREPGAGQGGFTLIEIMVAITLIAIAAAGSIPLLIVGMKAANNSKLQTQAKNLAQQRFESMRDLPFHVDRQNGPFVDLLDIYYTSVSTTSVTHTRAGETEVGRWVSGGAASPAPSGAFYQVSIASIDGYPSFSQTIDTQFLSVAGNALASSKFTAYDSQIEGRDQPPSLMVGVTVITTWNDHGLTHTYTSYTRISDSRGLTSALTTHGSAEFLRVSSAGPGGNALTVDLASADASGAQSTGSVAAADVRTLQAHDAVGVDYQGASAVATSPSGAVSQYPASMPLAGWTQGLSGTCGWVGSGPTQVSNVTATTASGLPKVPTDVDTGTPPTHQVAAQITSGSNTACGIFGFANQSTSYDPNLLLAADVPLVRINNDSQNNVVVNSKAWVNATTSQTNPHSVSSGANASSTKRVQVFPGAGYVTDGLGLVDILLTSASISCSSTVSAGTATQSASGSWNVSIDYWQATDTAGHGQRVSVPAYTWNSSTGTGSADPLASLNPANIVVYQNGSTVLHLSDYIASWSTTRSIVENQNSGVHQLDGIVSLSTQQVRADDLVSAVSLEVGNLSCVADDNR
jgi:prepilin-type N-terminal cleavage/methylation domain-containing protein